VVEDDPTLLPLVAGILSRSGYDVLTARGGEAAIGILTQHRDAIQLLLTDVLMPGVGGAELAEHAWERSPGLPVIFMSGYADPSSFPASVRERASGFLAKPFQWQALVTAVKNALRSAAREPAR
jgi:DNA-binding NtrC family response regulator